MRSRMGGTGRSRGRRIRGVGLIVALGGIGVACGGSLTETEALTESAVPESDAGDYSVVTDLMEGLELTDDQALAVSDVLDAYRGREMEPGTSWYVAADLQKILTSEQIGTLEAGRAEARAERPGRRAGRQGRNDSGWREVGARMGEGPGAGPGAAALDLSDEQAARLREIRESYEPQMQDIRSGLRAGTLTREEAAARLEAIRDAIHEATEGILTADQLAVLEEHRANAEARRGQSVARREEAKGQWEERRQAERAAMVEAMGLTPEQVAAIDALEVRPGGTERLSPEDVAARREAHHAALVAILDTDQEEILVLHGSLFRGAARRGARGAEARRGF